MGQGRRARGIRVAPQNRGDDGIVLFAITPAALFRKGALLHVEPWRLVAQDIKQLVEAVQQFVARAGKDAVMQLRIPVLEIHHLDRGAGLAMRFLDAGELRRGGMDGGIGRGYRFQPPPHFHHVGRARTFHAGHDFRDGRAG